MPEIKLKHVVSCTSEDNTHKADNLLSSDTYRKWKAARAGEKQTSVILQFEKEEQVHSIDIGNEGSAFVEVLVANSSAPKTQDYEVLLVTSSFMSPTESRNGTNLNRVRFFGPNQLQKSIAQEKWDRVKIVCSQPYNKNIAYGIAFVKFHSPPDKNEPPSSSPKVTKLGQFRIKDESPSSGSSLQPGSLFFNRENANKSSPSPKVSPQSDKLSYAAAALQAGGGPHSSGQASSTSSSSTSPQPPAKRKFEFSKERLSAAGPSPSNKKSPAGSPESKAATPKLKPSPASTPSPSTTKVSSTQRSTEKKKEVQSKPELKPKQRTKPQSEQQVPFNKIMEGVMFVLSGFQNPFRGELREKALEMGAKYRPDWTSDSTHLICAFANTPKYSQVKSAGGIIVRKEWVLDCHKRKQKISYKRYLMDGDESSSESEMEVDEDSEEEVKTKTPQKKEIQITPKKTPTKRDEEEEYAASTDVEEPGADEDESGVDTEDELQRVENESRRKKAAAETTVEEEEEDPYGGSTDENTDAEAEEDHPIPELPDFLSGKHFFLYGKFPNDERRLLLRYIVAFNGVIEDYMTDKVQFVVTSEGWHESFEDALMENENLNFVKPAWIYAINERQKLLPYQPYTVVP